MSEITKNNYADRKWVHLKQKLIKRIDIVCAFDIIINLITINRCIAGNKVL